MAKGLSLGIVGIALILSIVFVWPGLNDRRAESSSVALIDQYCTACHNGIDRAGDLALDALDSSIPEHDAEHWEAVVRKLRTGMMPPAGEPRPDRGPIDRLAVYLEE